jgi:simple sugar transport system ATP-binding protein
VTSPVSSLELVAPRSGPEFIEMRGISKRFGAVRALQDVSFSILSTEIHSLAGENGCGKSTLIKVLSGVHAPDEGEIVLEGKSHSHLSPPASQLFFRICDGSDHSHKRQRDRHRGQAST